MRLPFLALLLLTLAACTTTVPEPDATIPDPDWRDAALVEAIASDAVTAQHRLGSAGPISLPASFLTAGGDLATGGVVTQAQSGALSFSSTGQIACSTGMTGCQFKQATKASDTLPNAMSIQAQSGWSGATTNVTGANLNLAPGTGATNGGNVVVNLQAAANYTSQNSFQVFEGSNQLLQVNGLGATGNTATLWLLSGGTAPTVNNTTLQSSSGSTYLNAASSGGIVLIGEAASYYAGFNSNGLQLGTYSPSFGGATGGVLGLTNGSAPPTAGVSTGSIIQSYSNNLNLWAPYATNLAGNVNVELGARGTGTVPQFQVYEGGALRAQLGGYGGTAAGLTLNGGAIPAVYSDGSTYVDVYGPSNVGIVASGSFAMYAGSTYVDLFNNTGTALGGSNVVNIANGTAITSAPSGGATIQAISGALTVTAAGNTTPSATFGATTTTIAGTLDAGYVAVTPANGANTLTAAQSAVANLNLLAGATAAVTVTDALTPAAAKGALLFVRNNTTQTVTFGWSTGTTITLSTLTSALVTSDGTNAVKLMAGT